MCSPAPERGAVTFAFRPLTPEDLPMLHEWLLRPHVRQWWHEPSTIAELDRDYVSPSADSSTHAYIAMRGDMPIGFIQSYVVMGSGAGWWTGETDAGARGIDAFLANASDLGQGLGRALIRAFVDRLFADADVTTVQADPARDNVRAIRSYRGAGFAIVGDVDTPDGPATLMRVERGNR
jgi:RimJ/RimL family protein N-acetyltransferase